jgi:hypothetical protein
MVPVLLVFVVCRIKRGRTPYVADIDAAEKYGKKEPPVCNIALYRVPQYMLESAGLAVFEGDFLGNVKRKAIIISSSIKGDFCKFVLGHEIGHIRLNHVSNTIFVSDKRSLDDEIAADKYSQQLNGFTDKEMRKFIAKVGPFFVSRFIDRELKMRIRAFR